MNTFDCTDLQINPHNIKSEIELLLIYLQDWLSFLKYSNYRGYNTRYIFYFFKSGDKCDLAYIGATVLKFGPACMADDMTVQPKYKQKF